jgi:hypothetical protein
MGILKAVVSASFQREEVLQGLASDGVDLGYCVTVVLA